MALAESLRYINQKHSSKELDALTKALDKANADYLDNDKSPGRKVGEPDNKASHFYLALYWAKALANSEVKELSDVFSPVAKALAENEEKIIEELLEVEGKEQNIGGYYQPNDELASKAMRPSETLNSIINSI